MFLGDKWIHFVLQMRPRASDSALVYEYVTHACTCVAQGRRSLAFNKSRLDAPSPYALLRLLVRLFQTNTERWSVEQLFQLSGGQLENWLGQLLHFFQTTMAIASSSKQQ